MSRLWRCDVCGREDAPPGMVPYVAFAARQPDPRSSAGDERRVHLDICFGCLTGIWATGPTDALVAALRRTWAGEYPADAP